jgi:hypothetical protein
MTTLDQSSKTISPSRRKRRLITILAILIFVCLGIGWCGRFMQDMYPQTFSDSIAESQSLNVFICTYAIVPDSIYPPNHSGIPIREVWLEHRYVLTHPFPWGISVSVRSDEAQLNISFAHSVSYLDSIGSTAFAGPNIGYAINYGLPIWIGSNDFLSLPYNNKVDTDTIQYVFTPYDNGKPSKVLATFVIKKQFDSSKNR